MEWELCTDNNYWKNDENGFTVVVMEQSYWDDVTDTTMYEKFYWTIQNCPYGWNVLVNNNAKMKYIEFPN